MSFQRIWQYVQLGLTTVRSVMWARGLLMSTLCPMVAVGLWYGAGINYGQRTQLHFKSMAIWMLRDTVTRSWRKLSCHSSTAFTSCFSMIMNSLMSQGSVHNYWKLKMSQVFYSLHTHQTCHPLSMFGMLWIDVYGSMFQFPPKSSIFARSLKRNGTIFHRPQSTSWSTLCQGDASHYMRQMSHFFLGYLWPTDAYLYSQSCEIHRLDTNELI